jgi:hypothetical protein
MLTASSLTYVLGRPAHLLPATQLRQQAMPTPRNHREVGMPPDRMGRVALRPSETGSKLAKNTVVTSHQLGSIEVSRPRRES